MQDYHLKYSNVLLNMSYYRKELTKNKKNTHIDEWNYIGVWWAWHFETYNNLV